MTQVTVIQPEDNNLYMGGAMVNTPGFGSNAFNEAEPKIRAVKPFVRHVFNPSRHDKQMGFNTEGLNGTVEEMDAAGFSRRRALTLDMQWIGKNSTGMVVLPDYFEQSDGTFAEAVFHQSLYLPVWMLDDFLWADGDVDKLEAVRMRGIRYDYWLQRERENWAV
jgi:hypothetical protein